MKSSRIEINYITNTVVEEDKRLIENLKHLEVDVNLCLIKKVSDLTSVPWKVRKGYTLKKAPTIKGRSLILNFSVIQLPYRDMDLQKYGLIEKPFVVCFKDAEEDGVVRQDCLHDLDYFTYGFGFGFPENYHRLPHGYLYGLFKREVTPEWPKEEKEYLRICKALENLVRGEGPTFPRGGDISGGTPYQTVKKLLQLEHIHID